MSSDGSDIEMQSALPKKTFKKAPKSPTADILKKQEVKKLSTKEMINQALIDLKSRKGTSLYAIKKYLEEKYHVDVEKNNYLIKKYLKASVEIGTIVQTKGVGATGSFKLAAGKDKLEKTKKKKEKKSEKTEKSKPEKTKTKKKVESNDENKKVAKKMPKKVEISKNEATDKKEKDVTKKSKNKKEKVVKSKASKMAKGMQTPAKKRAAMMKRKSIGSIIKPPKMKPKAAA
ncbi:histone H1.1, embryonic-like [Vanessa cardui]|uniref:histone H1.1, embryonic-like n=1 Tax=Vanessa cardui TaxID=171605 RepID=UPI001F13804C|nr:histone H1.1, embryonic-like [Vanessa cardui]